MACATNPKLRLGTGVAAIGAALALAACGGSGSSSSAASSSASSSAASASTSQDAAMRTAVGTHQGGMGTYLTGASGRALYLWVADSAGHSNCSGSCAAAWPPLLTHGAPTAAHGAIAGDLGTISRGNGTRQVTYKGHPLYYFAGDTGPGTTSGQGSTGFGAKWWLVSPSGAAIMHAGAAAAGSSSSASSSASGGGSWG